MTELIKLERAVKSYLDLQSITSIPDGQIYAGSDFPDGGAGIRPRKVQLPCVIISASDSEKVAPVSRSQRATLEISVRTQRDDENGDTHLSRCEEVFNYIYASNAAVSISNHESNFSVMELILNGLSSEPQKRYWESKLRLTAFVTLLD